MNKYRLVGLIFLFLVPFSGCDCRDADEFGWKLEEDWPFEADIDAGKPDAGLDAGRDVGEDIGLDTSEDTHLTRDTDTETEPVEPWKPEEVEPGIPGTHALTDRTGLAVDPAGTLWLGYHACNDYRCSRPMLRVVHKPVGGDWVGEDIRAHDGIFGVDVIKTNEPIIVYPDSYEPVYRADMRAADGQWRTHTFAVPRISNLQYDGFDLTQDGRSYFISFAPDAASEVSLYRYHTEDPQPRWQARQPLEIRGSQAAMERGLRADDGDSVYLVNRSGITGIYGVYRYDEGLDRWPQSVELESYTDLFVHSLSITRNFRLCMSGSLDAMNSVSGGMLMVTCGSMFDLTQDVKVFESEVLSPSHPSSIIEGHDGTLYVAYNPAGNDELRVASLKPDSNRWEIETVYDGSSYGVSTAIDLSGDLVISFYTCDNAGRCSLKVVWETPDE